MKLSNCSRIFTARNGQASATRARISSWVSVYSKNSARMGASSTPIFITEGESDAMTPSELASEWLSTINTPQTEFVPIESASHLAFATAAYAYLAELVGRVRP
jgi:alpha-beta hydrolase superfamily lysophospholipase